MLAKTVDVLAMVFAVPVLFVIGCVAALAYIAVAIVAALVGSLLILVGVAKGCLASFVPSSGVVRPDKPWPRCDGYTPNKDPKDQVKPPPRKL